MEYLFGWLAGANDFYTFIFTYFEVEIYEFVKEVFAYFTTEAIYIFLKLSIFAIDVGMQVADNLLTDIGLFSMIENAIGGLDSWTYQVLTYLNFTQAVETITTAFATRFTIKFVPFIGA